MKKLFTLMLALLAITAYSQHCEVPEKYVLAEADDYAEYEEQIMACSKWLIETPLGENKRKRKEASTFLMKWVTGAPNVSVILAEGLPPMDKSNPELSIIFLAGWTYYALENEESTKEECALYALETFLDFYEENKDELNHSKEIKKLLKIRKKGKLEDYVENILKEIE